MSALLAFSSRSDWLSVVPSSLLVWEFSEGMVLKRNRINVEVFGPATGSAANRNGADHADEAIGALARLIGRQIAREQFEQRIAVERKVRRGTKTQPRSS